MMTFADTLVHPTERVRKWMVLFDPSPLPIDGFVNGWLPHDHSALRCRTIAHDVRLTGRRQTVCAKTGESEEHREKAHGSNEKKMSDGGRERAPLGVEGWKSSQK